MKENYNYGELVDSFTDAPTKDPKFSLTLEKSYKKVNGGFKAAATGKQFESYFNALVLDIKNSEYSPIVCHRKHANEVIGVLAHKKLWGMIKQMNYLKGDLDYSITLKGGKTVFIECKAGDSKLTPEQLDIITQYKKSGVPYFIFSQKGMKNLDNNIISSKNFEEDKIRIRKFLDENVED
ncbi:MAG: hypothetical protein FWE18_00050 [Alphaproteobacteria bacterium]|nr:hypothetical protein [Alphaproteobacteria bacterium]